MVQTKEEFTCNKKKCTNTVKSMYSSVSHFGSVLDVQQASSMRISRCNHPAHTHTCTHTAIVEKCSQ